MSRHRHPSCQRVAISRFRAKLLRWFDQEGRKLPWRRSRNRYQEIIAEVLLQRTRAETVAAFFPEFIQRYPTWTELDSADLGGLRRFLRPIGLWRRRSDSIKALAREMVARNGRFPTARRDIEALPGVGQYIANAIQLFCHGKPRPLLDTNVARVLERVFGPRKLADIRYDPYLQSLAKRVVRCASPRQINWAILDLAAKVCATRSPRCNICPLARLCIYKSTACKRRLLPLKQDDV
jgi:A/G-specific adenine glycosylase